LIIGLYETLNFFNSNDIVLLETGCRGPYCLIKTLFSGSCFPLGVLLIVEQRVVRFRSLNSYAVIAVTR